MEEIVKILSDMLAVWESKSVNIGLDLATMITVFVAFGGWRVAKKRDKIEAEEKELRYKIEAEKKELRHKLEVEEKETQHKKELKEEKDLRNNADVIYPLLENLDLLTNKLIVIKNENKKEKGDSEFLVLVKEKVEELQIKIMMFGSDELNKVTNDMYMKLEKSVKFKSLEMVVFSNIMLIAGVLVFYSDKKYVDNLIISKYNLSMKDVELKYQEFEKHFSQQ